MLTHPQFDILNNIMVTYFFMENDKFLFLLSKTIRVAGNDIIRKDKEKICGNTQEKVINQKEFFFLIFVCARFLK